jgi:hypothetical protein
MSTKMWMAGWMMFAACSVVLGLDGSLVIGIGSGIIALALVAMSLGVNDD